MRAAHAGTMLGALLLTLSLGVFASRARAGNDESLLIRNDAAITAGVVTATVSDGAAAWYNPAGLANARRNTFDINASVLAACFSTDVSPRVRLKLAPPRLGQSARIRR